MKLFGWEIGREARAGNPVENPLIPISDAESMAAFFGLMSSDAGLPLVTIDTAMEVPAVFDIVGFLPRTLANLPLHSFRKTAGAAERLDGDLQMLLNEAPNEEWTSFGARQYFWQQVFTVGRGMFWIERAGGKPFALWPMDANKTTVRRRNGRKFYKFDGKDEYPAADVIDVPFMLKPNGLDVYSPILKHKKTIGLALAMAAFAATFFGSGGMPPMSLEGPLPAGAEAIKRAKADIQRAIDMAKQAGSSFVALPPGYTLKPLGFDPAKGQMTEARLFQIQEIARIWGLPPAFVQDLSKGTFTNTEQQDLQLVKHLIAHWAKALEDELNLKLFGQRRRGRFVEHNLAGIERGDFKSRTEGMARAIQTGQLTPNEARALENRGPMEHGDKLYIQGATVPLGTEPSLIGHNGGPPLNDNQPKDPADAGNATD